MGKEFPLARSAYKRRPVLLAITSSGELITSPSIGDQRTQEPATSETSGGREAKDIEAESESSRRTKGTNACSSKSAGYRQDNKNRKSNRGDERKDEPSRRSAQEMGVIFPGSYCDDAKTISHYWTEYDRVAKGSLFQCNLCYRYLWLPFFHAESEQLSSLMRRYGNTEGYCRHLNRHRAAKLLMAKLQDLRRLEMDVVDKREFASLTNNILSDSEYDRKEVTNG